MKLLVEQKKKELKKLSFPEPILTPVRRQWRFPKISLPVSLQSVFILITLRNYPTYYSKMKLNKLKINYYHCVSKKKLSLLVRPALTISLTKIIFLLLIKKLKSKRNY